MSAGNGNVMAVISLQSQSPCPRTRLVLYRRISMGFTTTAALLLGMSLLTGATGTYRFFAWSIPSPTAASALGGFYVGIAIYGAVAAFAKTWQTARAIVFAAGLAPALLLIPTFLHHGSFQFGHPLACLWLILYILLPRCCLVFIFAASKSSEWT